MPLKAQYKSFVAIGLAALLTASTSAVETRVIATYPEIMGCESACLVAAAGWPLAYIVDYPGLSPVGSVSLTGAVLELDKTLLPELGISFTFWLALSGLAIWHFWRRKV